MKRLWPSTLAGQLALLLAVALLAAQLIHAFLLVNERQERWIEAISGPAVARLVDIAERIQDDAQPAQLKNRFVGRARIAETSAVTERMRRLRRVERRVREELAEGSLDFTEVRIGLARREKVAQWLPPSPRRHAAGPPRVLIISARFENGPWVNLVSPMPRIGEAVLSGILIQTGILYIVILAGVLWLVRRSSAPLSQLTHAAAVFGRARDTDPLPETGPADIRRLTASFNEMRARISAMLSEKDRMIGAIGHDLRTPLASLRLRAESVPDPAERDAMIASIVELEETLADILMLARLRQSGEDVREVDVFALVDAVAEDFRELGAAVNVSSEGRVTTAIRSNLTRRALRNVIDNAIKYGDRARVSVSRDSGFVRITVDDDGPGIPESELERVFDDFERLEISRSRQTGGSGLGLSLAREIFRLQGGDIEIGNRDEGGLRAVLSLPAA